MKVKILIRNEDRVTLASHEVYSFDTDAHNNLLLLEADEAHPVRIVNAQSWISIERTTA